MSTLISSKFSFFVYKFFFQRVEDEEIKSLFQYIQHYTPREVVLETLLRPFIPDYIPTIGSVDEFIKVPRPDGIPDFLGLKVGWPVEL
jgi:hypothetical protein